MLDFIIGALFGVAALAIGYYIYTDSKKRKAVVVNKPTTTGRRTGGGGTSDTPDKPQQPAP